MGIIVDLVIVLLIGLCTFAGYKRGLAKSLLKLCTTIIAIVIAIVLYKPMVNFVVNNTTIDENVQLSFERVLNNDSKAEDEKLMVKEDSGIPKPIAKFLNENIQETVEEKKQEAVTSVSRQAALLIIDLACIIAVYIVAKVILRIFTVLVDVVAKLPVIKQFNELGGLAFGLLEGVFIVLIVLAVISVITPLTGNYEISNLILSSSIGKILYNNNIFLNIIF